MDLNALIWFGCAKPLAKEQNTFYSSLKIILESGFGPESGRASIRDAPEPTRFRRFCVTRTQNYFFLTQSPSL